MHGAHTTIEVSSNNEYTALDQLKFAQNVRYNFLTFTTLIHSFVMSTLQKDVSIYTEYITSSQHREIAKMSDTTFLHSAH